MTVCIRGNVKLRIPATQDFISGMSKHFDEILTESVVDADCPSHSLLTLNGGEYLGGVLESDWSFSQGVANGEEVDESEFEH